VACALARIIIRELSPRSRASPSTSGTALLWAVAAYRLLQTDSTYGHALERHHPRPHGKARTPHGASFPLVCAMSASKEASHPQRAEEVL